MPSASKIGVAPSVELQTFRARREIFSRAGSFVPRLPDRHTGPRRSLRLKNRAPFARPGPFFKNATGRGLVPNQPPQLRPTDREEIADPHEVACPLALAYCANNDADPFRDIELAQNFPETVALFRIFDLARDSAAIAERHENEVAPGKTQMVVTRGPFVPIGPFVT